MDADKQLVRGKNKTVDVSGKQPKISVDVNTPSSDISHILQIY